MNKQLTSEVANQRHTEYEVDPLFLNRWSPRSYLSKEVADDELFALFEAARWAPSAYNLQPWRYVIARTKEDREKFYPFINPANRVWCEKAPVLAVVLSKKTNNDGQPNRAHAFDAGASWGYLALEATRRGLSVHAMGGFNADMAREVLQVPDDYDLHVVLAIGYRGEVGALPAELQEREKPSARRPLEQSLYEGGFGQAIRRASRS